MNSQNCWESNQVPKGRQIDLKVVNRFRPRDVFRSISLLFLSLENRNRENNRLVVFREKRDLYFFFLFDSRFPWNLKSWENYGWSVVLRHLWRKSTERDEEEEAAAARRFGEEQAQLRCKREGFQRFTERIYVRLGRAENEGSAGRLGRFPCRVESTHSDISSEYS